MSTVREDMLPNDVFLLQLRRFLETQLGPAPSPTDAQIGMIIRFVNAKLDKPRKKPKNKV